MPLRFDLHWSWSLASLQDFRFALRMLGKSPGFTIVAVLTLALGIGANTAIFSAMNAVILRSLPVHAPDELRLINWVGLNPEFSGAHTGPGRVQAPGGLEMGTSFSYPAYRALSDRSAGFTHVFAFSPKRVTAITRGEAFSAVSMLVSGNYFSGYGANPLIGRTITPEEDRPGAPPVAVITHRWWEQHCGFDPNVLGESITLNRVSFTVIGVLPRHYAGPMMGDASDIYVPMSAQPHLMPDYPLESPDCWWVQVMGRLTPGAKEAQAHASLVLPFQQTLAASRSKMDRPGILMEDGSRGQLILRREVAKPFLVLMAVVGLVLLIACANVAGLLLARGAARQQEMALRVALGANRWQLIRQTLTESLLLSLMGAGLGLVVATWLKQALVGILTKWIKAFNVDLRTDANVLVFTLAVSIFTALAFGLLPAIRASRVNPSADLKHRAPRLGTGKTLVAIQVGLSVLLVVGAGLMARTFANLTQVTPGFNPTNVLLFQVRPSQTGYKDQQLVELYDRIRNALAEIPGVRGVTLSSLALLSDSTSSGDISFPERTDLDGRRWRIEQLMIGEDFFRTMGIPLLLGSDFHTTDTAVSPTVAIVNETFSRRFFHGENPVGQTFLLHEDTSRRVQVVGVCRDAKYHRIRAEVTPILYLSQRQRPQGSVCFEVRSTMPPMTLVPSVRKAMAKLDPNLPISNIRTQDDQLDQSLAADRLFAMLGGAFAVLALILSCVGLYGLMAYSVARRTREIGLRMALGATRWNTAAPILREALLLTMTGLAVGIPVSLALVTLIQSQLYGVGPFDPMTLVGTSAILTSVALLAAWIPARRAARLDPVQALRSE